MIWILYTIIFLLLGILSTVVVTFFKIRKLLKAIRKKGDIHSSEIAYLSEKFSNIEGVVWRVWIVNRLFLSGKK
jgi:hypothetical protein